MPIRTFFRNLVPQEKKFYPMFEASAENLVTGAGYLNKLFAENEEVNRNVHHRNIKGVEIKGDQLSKTIFDELDKTFITPFEREDIHALSSAIEEVLDLINGCSNCIKLYKPRNLEGEITQFPVLILLGCQEIQHAVSHLKNLKNHDQIRRSCERITELEKQGDDLYHMLISNLFETEKDAIELIKKKELVQILEKSMDQIEDVADVCRTILIKMV